MSDRKLKDKDKRDVKATPDVAQDMAKPSQAGQPVDTEDGSSTDGSASAGSRLRRRLGIAAISVVGPLLAIGLGLFIYLSGGRYVSTDNAYVKSEKIAVSTDISGRVVDVVVRANQTVSKGALLFKIDPEPFQIAVERARAGLVAARQDGEALKSLYRQKLAGIERAKVDLAFLKKRFQRQKRLKRKAIASQSTFETADQNLQSARTQLTALEQDLAQVNAKLGGHPSTPVENLSGVMQAAAALKQAQLNLSRTEVRASLNGIVTNFELQAGEYVEEGKTVFSIVGTRDLWVQANFRETDMTHLRAGQTARITVDAYPDARREAVVDSIDPATGAEFALLPAQNATGNWVKVVQRLPVRLRIDEGADGQPLRAGMSVVVTVDTGHERTLSGLVHWIGGKLGG